MLSVAGHNEFESNSGGRCLALYPHPLERRVTKSSRSWPDGHIPIRRIFRHYRLKVKKPPSRNTALNNPITSYLLRGIEAHITRSRFSRNNTARIDKQKKTCVAAI